MKRFCRQHDVPFEECGKLVVATSHDEVPRLDQLHQRGIANGVPRLRMLSREQFREIEPSLGDGISGLQGAQYRHCGLYSGGAEICR